MFDLQVWKLDPPVDIGQLPFLRPLPDLVSASCRATIAVAAATIGLLEELLIVALEVVLQRDSLNARALVNEPRGYVQIGAVQLGIVGQLTLARRPDAEGLTRFVLATSMRLEEVATGIGETDQVGAVVAVNGRDMADQAMLTEVLEVAVPPVAWRAGGASQVVDGNDAEGADGG
jgi:hypothetical protein